MIKLNEFRFSEISKGWTGVLFDERIKFLSSLVSEKNRKNWTKRHRVTLGKADMSELQIYSTVWNKKVMEE
jgi:hypothetical protein